MPVKPLILLLFLFPGLSFSEQVKMYRNQDPATGTAVFSDHPTSNSQPVTIELEEKTGGSSNKATVGGACPSIEVVMYSTMQCVFCKKAVAYYKEKNIAYTEYFIDKDASANERFKKLDGLGTPLIYLNKTRLVGFTVPRFSAAAHKEGCDL